MSRIFRRARIWVAVLLAALFASLAVLSPGGRSATALTALNVGAGVSSGKAFGQVYTPGEVMVGTGSSVTWTINSAEPHSITFGQSPSGGPPPSWPVAGFTAPPPGPPGPAELGSVDYSGSQFINTGLLFQGSKATVRFTTPGDYTFICVIHPGMTGVVHVVNSGSPTTQAEADRNGQSTSSFILDPTRVANLRQQALASTTSEVRADGTTKWTVAVGAMSPPEPLPGGGTGFLDLMEFNPDPAGDHGLIKAGDTVTWKAADPHTVTFLAIGRTTAELEGQYGGDPAAVPLIKPSGDYDGTSLYTSGLLASGAPGAPDSFSLTFPNTGTFPYLCLLHDELGMKGLIVVGPGATLPNTGSGPASTGHGLPWALWLAAGLAGTALALGGLAFGARRLAR